MADTLLKVIGIKQLTASLRKKRMKLDKRSVIYKKAVIFLDGWIQRNFDKDGRLAHPGTGWKPLAPSTIKARAKGWGDYVKDSSPKILRNRGTLKSRWKHDWNNRRGIIENFATERGVYYGLAHHEGKGNLPERRILPKDEQVMPQIKKLFGQWIRTSLK